MPFPPYILIRQACKGCDVVTVTAQSETFTNYSGRTGRNDAKRAANALAKRLGFPLFNVKKGTRGHPGALVAVPVV